MSNLNLISMMTNEEKIQFVTLSAFKTSSLGSFNFPSIEFSFSFDEDSFLIFPSKDALGSLFNDNLLLETIRLKLEDSKIASPYKLFSFNIDLNKENYSEDAFLNARYISQCSKYIHEYNGKTCLFLDDNFILPTEHNSFIDDMYLEILKNGHIDYIVVRNIEELKFFKEKFNYQGEFFAQCDDIKEVIPLINNGALYIFSQNENLPNEINDELNNYEKKALMNNNGELSEVHFNELVEHNLILNKKKLDENIDKIISLILELKSSDKSQDEEEKKGYLSSIPSRKEALDKVFDASITLIKNNEDILPLTTKNDTLFIGDFDPNISDSIKLTSLPSPELLYNNLFTSFDINNYLVGNNVDQFIIKKLDVNFRHTYVFEKELKDINGKFTKVVLFVDFKNNKKLNTEYFKLISYFSKMNKKVILLVKSRFTPNFDFLDKVSACLLSYDPTTRSVNSLLDTVFNNICPKGHFIKNYNENYNLVPNYNLYNETIPFGTGLSYAKFEYSNFKLTSSGINFEIINNSSYDGQAVIYLFVKKEDSKSIYKYNILRGYLSCDLKAHQGSNVSIEFDDLTFAYFDTLTSSYGIEGGKYLVELQTAYNENVYEGEVSLSEVLDNKFSFNEVDHVERILNEEKVNNKLSLKGKITIASIIHLYLIASFLILLFNDLMHTYVVSLYAIIYIVLSVISVISFIVTILLLCLKNKKKTVSKDEETKLNDLLTNTFILNEKYKVVYDKPIDLTKEKGIDVVKEDNIEKQREDNYVMDQVSLDVTSDNSLKDKVSTYKTFEDLFVSYHRYLEQCGLIIDKTSLKSFLASLGSNKLIILNLTDKELEKEFIFYTLKFFGNELTYIDNISFKDNFDSYNDILVNDGKNTDLLDNLLKARDSYLLSLCPIKVDNIKQFAKYLKFIIDSSIVQKEQASIVVNDVHDILLDRSLKYIIIPEETNFVENMTRDLIEASLVINISLRKQDFVGEETTLKAISYTNFADLIYDTKKEFFVSEKSFKHFDELENKYLDLDFVIGNVSTIQIETYSSILLSLELSENEVIDLIISSKIIPLLKNTSIYESESAPSIISEDFRSIFDEEALVKCLNYLQKVVVEVPSEEHTEEVSKEEVSIDEGNIVSEDTSENISNDIAQENNVESSHAEESEPSDKLNENVETKEETSKEGFLETEVEATQVTENLNDETKEETNEVSEELNVETKEETSEVSEEHKKETEVTSIVEEKEESIELEDTVKENKDDEEQPKVVKEKKTTRKKKVTKKDIEG